jgi:hypothetical protein
MNILIVLGNINEKTFANSIVAANIKSMEVFNSALDKIYVINTIESDEILSKSNQWKEHLSLNKISQECLVHGIVEGHNPTDTVENYIN